MTNFHDPHDLLTAKDLFPFLDVLFGVMERIQVPTNLPKEDVLVKLNQVSKQTREVEIDDYDLVEIFRQENCLTEVDQLEQMFCYVGKHLDLLDVEQQHRIERLRIMVAELLKSFLVFSEEEKKLQTAGLIQSVAQVNQELAEAKERIEQHQIRVFQKNQYLINS